MKILLVAEDKFNDDQCVVVSMVTGMPYSRKIVFGVTVSYSDGFHVEQHTQITS